MVPKQVTSPSEAEKRLVQGEPSGAITPPEAWVAEFDGYREVDGACNWLYMVTDGLGERKREALHRVCLGSDALQRYCEWRDPCSGNMFLFDSCENDFKIKSGSRRADNFSG